MVYICLIVILVNITRT